jgi:hypothetical protein
VQIVRRVTTISAPTRPVAGTKESAVAESRLDGMEQQFVIVFEDGLYSFVHDPHGAIFGVISS